MDLLAFVAFGFNFVSAMTKSSYNASLLDDVRARAGTRAVADGGLVELALANNLELAVVGLEGRHDLDWEGGRGGGQNVKP